MASFMTKRFGSAMLNQTGKNRLFSSGTSPTYRAAVSVADEMHNHVHSSQPPIGQWAPVAVLMGFLSAAGFLALHAATQQLGRSPSVKVTKKNRESIAEVFDPDSVVGTSIRFVDKSFLRKIGRIQEPKRNTSTEYPDPFTRSRREIESLKSVGVLR